MQRRQFLRNIAWLTGGLLITGCTPAKVLMGDGQSLRGRVLSKKKAVFNAVVSDGYNVVTTNKKGEFEFTPHPEAVSIFISTPSGYEFANENGISRHYRLLQEENVNKEIIFELVPLSVSDNEHQFLIWADPQVAHAKDVDKMMKQSVPDVKKLVAAAAGALMHGITVGDIVWDKLELFSEYSRAVNKMGIPFFQCLGNHDMDYRNGGDETSDDTFQKTYGPTYYSFNRGEMHYVVMDNVRYLGKDREYDGFFQQHQLDWLIKDLSFVPRDKTIVLCVHIPVHKGTKNNQALYDILGDRNVHIMSGHTHYHVNAIKGNIYEHNHGTVCGAWWTGPICGDGTPGGYGVYKAKGKELSWHYQSTGKDADHQMALFVNDFNDAQKQLIANIWNYDPQWKNEYWIDDMRMGELEQFEGYDPLAYSIMLGPELPKPRGFAEPKLTNHLFRSLFPANAKNVKVIATDRFGNKYTSVHQLNG